jgi:ketosteroid isomerase-like protein
VAGEGARLVEGPGEDLEASICSVFHVTDGVITKIYEYLDPAAVASVFGPRPAGAHGPRARVARAGQA